VRVNVDGDQLGGIQGGLPAAATGATNDYVL